MSGTRARRLTPPGLMAGGLAAAALVLRLHDPHGSGSYALCPWLLLTGTYCPGCGGLRAVNDLTHGDVAAAASSNVLLVAAVPFAAYFLARAVHEAWTGTRGPRHPRAQAYASPAMALLLVAFAVLRNLPVGAWLAP